MKYPVLQPGTRIRFIKDIAEPPNKNGFEVHFVMAGIKGIILLTRPEHFAWEYNVRSDIGGFPFCVNRDEFEILEEK